MCVSKSQEIIPEPRRSPEERIQVAESISPRSYRAIQAAISYLEVGLPAMERRQLDLDKYRITVVETASTLFVLFRDAEIALGHEKKTWWTARPNYTA